MNSSAIVKYISALQTQIKSLEQFLAQKANATCLIIKLFYWEGGRANSWRLWKSLCTSLTLTPTGFSLSCKQMISIRPSEPCVTPLRDRFTLCSRLTWLLSLAFFRTLSTRSLSGPEESPRVQAETNQRTTRMITLTSSSRQDDLILSTDKMPFERRPKRQEMRIRQMRLMMMMMTDDFLGDGEARAAVLLPVWKQRRCTLECVPKTSTQAEKQQKGDGNCA